MTIGSVTPLHLVYRTRSDIDIRRDTVASVVLMAGCRAAEHDATSRYSSSSSSDAVQTRVAIVWRSLFTDQSRNGSPRPDLTPFYNTTLDERLSTDLLPIIIGVWRRYLRRILRYTLIRTDIFAQSRSIAVWGTHKRYNPTLGRFGQCALSNADLNVAVESSPV